jgi:hypothetical protein
VCSQGRQRSLFAHAIENEIHRNRKMTPYWEIGPFCCPEKSLGGHLADVPETLKRRHYEGTIQIGPEAKHDDYGMAPSKLQAAVAKVPVDAPHRDCVSATIPPHAVSCVGWKPSNFPVVAEIVELGQLCLG